MSRRCCRSLSLYLSSSAAAARTASHDTLVPRHSLPTFSRSLPRRPCCRPGPSTRCLEEQAAADGAQATRGLREATPDRHPVRTGCSGTRRRWTGTSAAPASVAALDPGTLERSLAAIVIASAILLHYKTSKIVAASYGSHPDLTPTMEGAAPPSLTAAGASSSSSSSSPISPHTSNTVVPHLPSYSESSDGEEQPVDNGSCGGE